MTILDIAQSMKGRLRDGYSTQQSGVTAEGGAVEYGTAIGDSSGGYVTVVMDGSPDQSATYQFEVEVDAPVTDGDRIAYVRQGGQAKAIALETLSQVAQDAEDIANATNQHFWADTNGVHVSTDEDDPAGERNILINSLGILLRKAANALVSISESAVAFYDGEGSSAGNVTAAFGKDGAIVGPSGTSQVLLNHGGMLVSDSDGVTIADIGLSGESAAGRVSKTVNIDAPSSAPSHYEGRSGSLAINNAQVGRYIDLTITWLWNGSETSSPFSVSFVAGTDGTATRPVGGASNPVGYNIVYTASSGLISISVAYPEYAAYDNYSAFRAIAEYDATARTAPAFTVGTRASGTVGAYTSTLGQGLIASAARQTVIGGYNVEDTGKRYALIVGNGSDETNRSNAFTVGNGGDITASGEVIDGNGNKLSDPCDLSTATGTLQVAQGGSGQTGTSTDTTISNIITAGTGITITEAHYCTWGKVAMLMVGLKRSTAISAGGAITIGSVKSGHRPVTDAAGGSNTLNGWLSTGGNFTARNISGSQISANTAIYISLTYLLP